MLVAFLDSLKLDSGDYRASLLMAAMVLVLLITIMLLVHFLRPREKFPYERQELLTAHEREFYELLTPIAVELGLTLFIKLRLADILAVEKGQENYMTHFNKIKAKHTDFVLCDPETLEVIAGIELDDASHEREDRMERDAFVDAAYAAAGIPLFHEWLTKDTDKEAYTGELKERLLELLQES